jgi:hypothetical protein
MYSTLVTIHSILRWLIVLAAVVAILYAVYGMVTRQRWTSLGDQIGSLFTWSVRINLLLGFVLWVMFFTNIGFNFFYHVIHPGIMFVALALAEILAARRGRATEESGRWRLLLLGTLIPFALILFAIPRWDFP